MEKKEHIESEVSRSSTKITTAKEWCMDAENWGDEDINVNLEEKTGFNESYLEESVSAMGNLVVDDQNSVGECHFLLKFR